jgi:deferrochelatase/peroxidase EfeB
MTREPQSGIYHGRGRTPPPFFVLLLLDVDDGVQDLAPVWEFLRDLWEMYGLLQTGRIRDLVDAAQGVDYWAPSGELDVLLGFGKGLFDDHGAEPVPAAWTGNGQAYRFRRVVPVGDDVPRRERMVRDGAGIPFAEGLGANPGDADIAIQFTATTALAVERAVVETWKMIFDRNPPLRIAGVYPGSARDDGRSWLDFHDGLSNLSQAEREEVVLVSDDDSDEWTRRGTYLTFLRLEIDLDVWRSRPADQNRLVGREKFTGCPFVDVAAPGMPESCRVTGAAVTAEKNRDRLVEELDFGALHEDIQQSHVMRTNHHTDDGPKIYRQGYQFFDPNQHERGFRVGLNFVAFQKDPGAVLGMLTNAAWLGSTNFGGAEQNKNGSMTLLHAHAAGIFFVPPRSEDGRFPGAETLSGAVTDPAPVP